MPTHFQIRKVVRTTAYITGFRPTQRPLDMLLSSRMRWTACVDSCNTLVISSTVSWHMLQQEDRSLELEEAKAREREQRSQCKDQNADLQRNAQDIANLQAHIVELEDHLRQTKAAYEQQIVGP